MKAVHVQIDGSDGGRNILGMCLSSFFLDMCLNICFCCISVDWEGENAPLDLNYVESMCLKVEDFRRT